MADSEQQGPRTPRAGRDLPAAIAVGLGLFAYVVVTLTWWPQGFIVLLVVLTSIGAIEVHQALRRVEMSSAIVPVVVGNVLIIGGTYAAAQAELVTNVPWHVVLLGTIGGTVLLALIWRMFGGADGYARDSAASLFIIGYIPLLASFAGLILAQPVSYTHLDVYKRQGWGHGRVRRRGRDLRQGHRDADRGHVPGVRDP